MAWWEKPSHQERSSAGSGGTRSGGKRLARGIGVYGSSVQGELASYRRGGYPGGPTARAAVRYVDLSERVRTVEWWLGQLEPWERLAAEYWMECRTLPAVAEELGIEYRQARRLIEVLPVVIWMRAQRGIESDSL